MRIGFDVSQTGPERAGCGCWADSLIRALERLDTENEYVLYPAFGWRFWEPDHAAATFVAEQHNFRRGPRGLSREQSAALWAGPRDALFQALGRPDVIHANNYFCPPSLGDARTVFTVYDLLALERPDLMTEENRLVCFDGLFEAATRADALVTISRHSRDRFLHFFPHYPAERVHVVRPASRFSSADGPPDPAAAPAGLLPGRFWLSVGTREPRKNLRQILRAHASVLASGDTVHPLVLAGGRGWLEDDLQGYADDLGTAGRVRFLGYVPEETLRWLYASCLAFVYVPVAEGFGLPPLEAMSQGAAVISSSSTSLPEAVGDAALLVAPDDLPGLVDAMRRLAREEPLRESLRRAGREHAGRFSWDSSARNVLRVYAEVRARPQLRSEILCEGSPSVSD